MTAIAQRIADIRAGIPQDSAALVAVSKYHSAEAIAEAYAAGQRIFGESRVQELQEKQARLPSDIAWHFIGHLQPNKVKYIAPYIALVHAVDTPKLLSEIDRQARRFGRRIEVLLQIHVAAEATKFGMTFDECRALLDKGEWRDMQGIQIAGLMCMATHTDDESRIRAEFRSVRTFFDEIKARHFADCPAFRHRSYGMSEDYRIALAEGSTLVRIGSAIFGERQ